MKTIRPSDEGSRGDKIHRENWRERSYSIQRQGSTTTVKRPVVEFKIYPDDLQ